MSTHLSAEYSNRSLHSSIGLDDKTPAFWAALSGADITCGLSILLADAVTFTLSLFVVNLISLSFHHTAGDFLAAIRAWTAMQQTAILRSGLLFIGVSCYFAGHGHFRDRLRFWVEMRDVVLVSMVAAITALGLTVLAEDSVEAYVLVACWVMFPALTVVLRWAIKHVLNAIGLWQIPVIVVGDQYGVADAVSLLKLGAFPGYKVVGTLHPSLVVEKSFSGRCRNALRQSGARRLILSCDLRNDTDYTIMQSVVRHRIPFSVLPQPIELPVVGCTRISFFGYDTVMLRYRDNLAQGGARCVKIIFDQLVSVLVFTMCSPIFLVISLLITRDSGRIFFGHKRVGHQAKSFSCLKFRTMVMNSSEVLRELLAHNLAARVEWNDTQKLTNDPRVTRVGRLLRATSLDELPQLLNVLRQEMSLIGPRPIVEQEAVRYGENITYYYSLKPGLTGLWQVSGRSDTSYAQRVRLDCWYARNWSIWHDIAILAKTVPAVLRRDGAR